MPLVRDIFDIIISMIKILTISDLHLGVPESVFSSDANVKNFIKQIKQSYFKGSERFRIQNLILLGDYIDLSETWDKDAYGRGKEVLEMFLNEFTIDNITWIPGNHDHHLWVREVERLSKYKYGLSRKTGTLQGDGSFFKKNMVPDWYAGNVSLSYPHITVPAGKDRTLILHHGHFIEAFEYEHEAEIVEKKLKVEPVEAVESIVYKRLEKRFYETKFMSRWVAYRMVRYIGMWLIRLAPIRYINRLEDKGRRFIRWYLEKVMKVDFKKSHEYVFVMGHEHNSYTVQKWFNKTMVRIIDLGGWVVSIHNYRLTASVFVLDAKNEMHTKRIVFGMQTLNRVFQQTVPLKLPDFKKPKKTNS